MGCSQSKDAKEVDSERPIQLDRDSKRFESPIVVDSDSQPAKSPILKDADNVQCIVPHEGFVVQTRRVGTNVTFYVNIVHHEQAKSVLGLNIKRSVVDGENCSAYSVVLPSTLYRHVSKHDTPEIKQAALSCIQLVNKLFDVHLDLNCEILQAPRYMGDGVDQVWLNLPINVSPSPSEPNTPIKNRHASFRTQNSSGNVGDSSPVRQSSVPAMNLPESKPALAAPTAASPAPAAVASNHHSASPAAATAVPAVHHSSPSPAPAATKAPVVDYNQPHTIPHHEEVELVVPAPKPVPPKMHGWLKKRGHVVLNWKSRYFVLDNGYLTYFVDKLDHPPYGKDMKGQLCLAGYREVPIAEGAAAPAASAGNRRGSSLMGMGGGADDANASHRIHLVYDPTLFDPSQATGNSKGEDFQDLLLEAATSEEKSAWVAAIGAHTEYFEASLASGGANSLLKASPLVTITPGDGRSSTVSTAGTSPHRMTSTGDNRGSTSNYSVVDDNKRWMIFLHSGEEIVLTGLTAKPNPMGIHLMRQLILTSHKRLLYIDGKTMEQKGEIEWSNDITAAYPQIKQIDEMTFEIIESAKKTYKFIAKDMLNATNWVNAVNATVRRF